MKLEEIPTALDFLYGDENASNDWQDQFSRYMDEPDIDKNLNPLEWWKNHSKKYPLIFNLGKQFLCIPATFASSERTFSSAGNIVTSKRNCLSPEKVNMLTFLYENKNLFKLRA